MEADAAVAIRTVETPRDLDTFVRLPWRIYADDPAWVPPLIADVKKALDHRHPFHEHGQVACFLAEQDGEAVGRIAAIENRRYNEFHGDRTGFFGLFESVDDPAVARALLARAEAWLRQHGLDSSVGPMNFSTNEELSSPGVLLNGFDRPPLLLMSHTRPYYPRLLEAAGYEKVKDLLAYWLEGEPPERLVRGVERIARGIDGLTIRTIEMKRLEREVERIQSVYNSAWERNWAFVPLTDAEIRHLARELRPIVDPRFVLIAEIHGDPVAFAIALPDYNQALRHANGRLFPFGLLKVLWHRRRIDRLRVFTLGIRPERRRTGIDAMLYLRIFQAAARVGRARGEASWILEDNWEMRRALERMGGAVYKTYRVYGKPLGARGGG